MAFTEIARRQRVMEIGGIPALNAKEKWIPVRYNRMVPAGDAPVCYDFEGFTPTRRNGKVEFVVNSNNTTLIRGNQGDSVESPHGLLLVAPTPNNIAKLAAMAASAAARYREAVKTVNGDEEVLEVRKYLPKFERMDVEDEETMQSLRDSVFGNKDLLKEAVLEAFKNPELRAELLEALTGK